MLRNAAEREQRRYRAPRSGVASQPGVCELLVAPIDADTRSQELAECEWRMHRGRDGGACQALLGMELLHDELIVGDQVGELREASAPAGRQPVDPRTRRLVARPGDEGPYRPVRLHGRSAMPRDEPRLGRGVAEPAFGERMSQLAHRGARE